MRRSHCCVVCGGWSTEVNPLFDWASIRGVAVGWWVAGAPQGGIALACLPISRGSFGQRPRQSMQAGSGCEVLPHHTSEERVTSCMCAT